MISAVALASSSSRVRCYIARAMIMCYVAYENCYIAGDVVKGVAI